MNFQDPFDLKLIDLPVLGAVLADAGPIFYYGTGNWPMAALRIVKAEKTATLMMPHLLASGTLKVKKAAHLGLGVHWKDEIKNLPLPRDWSADQILNAARDAANSGIFTGASKLLRATLIGLKSGEPQTQRGNFQEFLDVLQAMADLAGHSLLVTIGARGRADGGASRAPELARFADPHTLRLPIRHTLLWFEPSRATLYLGNHTVEWHSTQLGITSEKDPSAHRLIAAGGTVSAFYEAAASELKMTKADRVRALAKFKLA